ncbi:MAG: putative secreted protein [Polyangiaceae bacterium]|jgi:hypothetical protein|nr:putative secreted protein [Polyangiaceae bacterium]
MALLRLSVVVAGSLLALACNKETPPAAEEPRSASNAAAPQAVPPAGDAASAAAAPATPDAPATGAAKFTDAAFEVSLEPKGAAKAGQASAAEVTLVAKAPYHVNDKYPIKLKLKETPGVKFDNLIVTKDAAKVETMKAVMPVSFTPDAAGKRTVAGQFAFSVCTEDKCLMEKRDLLVELNVE